MAPTSCTGKLLPKGRRKKSMATTPEPQMGHRGPFKKPRLTNRRSRTAAKTTSLHQPKNENRKKHHR